MTASKTKTKRPRSPRLPNPKESRQTIQFRVTERDKQAIHDAIAAAAKILGITPSVSDVTRMAVVAYPAHARELADANRAREAAEAKVASMRKQLDDAIKTHNCHIKDIANLTEERDALRAQLDAAGGGLPNGHGHVVHNDDDVPTVPTEPVTCIAGRHVLMFDGPCADCLAETQEGQEQVELASEAG